MCITIGRVVRERESLGQLPLVDMLVPESAAMLGVMMVNGKCLEYARCAAFSGHHVSEPKKVHDHLPPQ
jgi:hypothetical protein